VSAPPRPRRLTRTGIGAATGAAGLLATTLALVPYRTGLALPSIVLLYLVPVLLTAAAGGLLPALGAAVAADLLVNFWFVAPYRTFAVDTRDGAVTLVVYLLVAAAVSIAVDAAAAHRATAVRREVEARLLAAASTGPIADTSVTRLLEEIRRTYRMSTVALTDSAGTLQQVGPAQDGPAVLTVDAGHGLHLTAWGPELFAEDRRALHRLAAAAAHTVETQHLAGQATELTRIDRTRAALLGAVGHDLRTPLAGIKAAVSSLRQADVDFGPADRADLLATIEVSADRLTTVVDNLLALSRLQAGVLAVDLRPVAVDAVLAQALLSTDTHGVSVQLDVPDDLPLALADAGLLERVAANLIANACAASPAGRTVRLSGTADTGQVRLAVIDDGPGIPAEARETVFAPFRRLDDDTGNGLGLGLAIARGFTEAQGGTLLPTDTPGGGLTMTITLPVAS
jgi:two-component system sensor histidine kinase KdpD